MPVGFGSPTAATSPPAVGPCLGVTPAQMPGEVQNTPYQSGQGGITHHHHHHPANRIFGFMLPQTSAVAEGPHSAHPAVPS